jgi:hypothetical protein
MKAIEATRINAVVLYIAIFRVLQVIAIWPV